MNIKKFCPNIGVYFNSLTKIFFNSKKKVLFIPVLLAVIIIIVFNYLQIKEIDVKSQLKILTGLSLLSSFFLLTLQNINFKYLNSNFQKKKKISKNRYNKESVIIRSTVFSLAITIFVLIGICFLLYIFNVNILYLLILLISYFFVGIIYTIILWNYFAANDHFKE